MATNDKNTTPATQTPATPAKANEAQNEYIGSVLARINQFQENGDLRLPANYAPENALRSAYLILLGTVDTNNSPVLETCTKESIANSLLDMVLKGLNPAKKQGYFIAYGKKLEFQVSYLGNLAIAKRVANVIDVTGGIIYDGDEFAFKIDTRTGRKEVTVHNQSFENIDNTKIKGAYATVLYDDGTTDVEIMAMPMIIQSWQQGKAKGNSPAHKNFPDQMALKTVKNRAVKVIIGASDDSALFEEENDDYDHEADRLQHNVTTKGNRTQMNFAQTLPSPVEQTAQLPEAKQQAQPPVAEKQPEPEKAKVKDNPAAGLQPSQLFDDKKEQSEPGF